ncbi:MAG TPA: APC family permease [Jiangellaceae bacterium]
MGQLGRRVLIGRKLATARLQQPLPKRVALPVLASDSLSSVGYATQEILVVVTLGGLTYLYLAPWAAAVVILAMVLLVMAYRRLVFAYPSGGGDFDAAHQNLGSGAGLATAGLMMADYVMTVAVSVAAAADNVVSAFPDMDVARIPVAGVLIVLILALNLRGVRQRGPAFALPAYLFIAGIVAMLLWGFGSAAVGTRPLAESAEMDVQPELSDLTTVAVVFLFVRAVASGSAALTGVRAIASGVPSFNRPRRENAATTLAMMGAVSMAMFAAVTALAVLTEVRYVRDACALAGFDCAEFDQRTAITQVAGAVFGEGSPPFIYVAVTTVLILLVAANTAFNGYPILASLLAKHRYLPRQLYARGDQRAYAGGMLLIALAAGALIVAFDGSVVRLVPLYILVVFAAHTLGQTAMVRHWMRLLDDQLRPGEASRAVRRIVLSGATAVFCAAVVAVVVVTQFLEGAWIAVAAVPMIVGVMVLIHRYYRRVNAELAVPMDKSAGMLPSRVHAIVLVSRIHRPALRAVAYARVGRPDVLEAVTVSVNEADTRELVDEWDRRDIPVPLKVLDSPYREITRPVVEYVRAIRRASPRDLVAVYIPEYVARHWWEQLLHNKSTVRLKGRLALTRGVVVTSVPWQLEARRNKSE